MQFTVENDNERLDIYLASKTAFSRSKAKNAIKSGAVSVNEEIIKKPSYILQENDNIKVSYPVQADAGSALDITPHILFQDSHLLVVNKPAGIVVHPDDTHRFNSLSQTLETMGIPLSRNNPERPGVVHRLDKNTEGLLIFSKTEEACEKLMALFKNRQIEKHYYALVSGCPKEDYFDINLPIGRHPTQRHKMTALPVALNPRAARTEVTVLDRRSTCSLVDVRIHTGRTHQIRVHLHHLGFPIEGDPIYQNKKNKGDSQKLQAYYLKFTHPFTGATLEIELPLSHRFKKNNPFQND